MQLECLLVYGFLYVVEGVVEGAGGGVEERVRGTQSTATTRGVCETACCAVCCGGLWLEQAMNTGGGTAGAADIGGRHRCKAYVMPKKWPLFASGSAAMAANNCLTQKMGAGHAVRCLSAAMRPEAAAPRFPDKFIGLVLCPAGSCTQNS